MTARRRSLLRRAWPLLATGLAALAACVPARAGGDAPQPVIAATDYIKTYADQIRAFVPRDRVYHVLGTDGFGRSDSRAKLRHFFEVNRSFVALAALRSLVEQGELKAKTLSDAIRKYGIDPEKADPTKV